MLKQRIITALALLAVLLPAVFYPRPEAFAVVALVLVTAGAWEWARLNQCSALTALALGGAFAVGCTLLWVGQVLTMNLRLLWIGAGCGWVIASAWLLRSGVQRWSGVPQTLRLVAGLLALWTAWLAVVQARMVGTNFMFSVLFLVWAADVFAYFFGRALGGRWVTRKLAASISPGKTWEGALGGMFGVMLCGFGWRWLDAWAQPQPRSLYTHLGDNGLGFMVLALIFLTMMSVVGDLAESLFKRSAGVKDSSALLPGHGGVLDRIDALLPILPLAMMLYTL